jgi:hypothetical protein
MEFLPDCIRYLTNEDIQPKPLTHLPDGLNYLQKDDLEITPIESIIKMTKFYLDYENPLLYKLYLHFNPQLSKEEVDYYEKKITALKEKEKEIELLFL